MKSDDVLAMLSHRPRIAFVNLVFLTGSSKPCGGYLPTANTSAATLDSSPVIQVAATQPGKRNSLVTIERRPYAASAIAIG